MTREPLLLLAVWLAGLLAALVLARWWRTWRGSAIARRRAARAGAGEQAAAVLLERAGFRILARQARTQWSPTLDDEPQPTELRADYLVESEDGELLVAEVKTGEVAPQLATAATRRQLLEYHVAFGARGVLLVCPERGAIHRVGFPGLALATTPAPPPAPATSRARSTRA